MEMTVGTPLRDFHDLNEAEVNKNYDRLLKDWRKNSQTGVVISGIPMDPLEATHIWLFAQLSILTTAVAGLKRQVQELQEGQYGQKTS